MLVSSRGSYQNVGTCTVSPPNARWKYAIYIDPTGATPAEFELYDLEGDPDEALNLVDKRTGRGRTRAAEGERVRMHERHGEACSRTGTPSPALPVVT